MTSAQHGTHRSSGGPAHRPPAAWSIQPGVQLGDEAGVVGHDAARQRDAVGLVVRGRPCRIALRDVLFAFTRLIGILLIPAGIGLAIVVPEAMEVIGGENWRPAGPLLRALALAVTVQGFINAAGNILASAGRARRLFGCSVAFTLAMAVAYPIGYAIGQTQGDGVLGVAWAYGCWWCWRSSHRTWPIACGRLVSSQRAGFV